MLHNVIKVYLDLHTLLPQLILKISQHLLCYVTTECRLEIADVLRRKKVDVACVQEMKWKGFKARIIGHDYKSYVTMEKTARGIALE